MSNNLPDLLDFVGEWLISRVIEDARADTTGHLQGRAWLRPDGPGLVYDEQGELRLPGAAPLTATRRYLWRPAQDGIEVMFDDERPFHRITSDGVDVHDCPPDLYRVAYDFEGWPKWSARWAVSGPRKDYAMTTMYRRS